MNIKRSVLEKIIREEFLQFAKTMLDEANVVDAGDKKKDIKPADAMIPGGGSDAHEKAKSGKPEPKDDPELDDEPDKKTKSAEEDLEDAEDNPEEDDSEEEKTSPKTVKVSRDVPGKKIQSITAEPKSKVIPGAQEVIISFDEDPEALRIIVTPKGTIRYVYKGFHETI